MNKLIFSLFLAIALLPGLVFAQQRVVTGTVMDEYGPLSRATVAEKLQPGNAVAADDHGKFRIVLKGSSNTLVVTYLNYQRQEVNLKKETGQDMRIVMQQSTQGMDEAVEAVGDVANAVLGSRRIAAGQGMGGPDGR